MFKTTITNIRIFSKGPGSESDDQWIRTQKAILLHNGQKDFVGFDEFINWAKKNLNLSVMN